MREDCSGKEEGFEDGVTNIGIKTAYLWLATHDHIESAVQVLSLGCLHVVDVHLVLCCVHGNCDCTPEAIWGMPLVPLDTSSEIIHQAPLCRHQFASQKGLLCSQVLFTHRVVCSTWGLGG